MKPSKPRWRSMKSAPKDKQIILADDYGDGIYVTQGRLVDVCHTNELMKVWRETGVYDASKIPAEGHWMEGHVGIMEHGGATTGKTWELRVGVLFNPIGWMPLPEPGKRSPRPPTKSP